MVLFAEATDKRLVTVDPHGIVCAIGGGILAGFLVGTLHAWLITSVRLPPFVATLATLVGLRSFARAICEYITDGDPGAAQYQQSMSRRRISMSCKRVRLDLHRADRFSCWPSFTWLLLSRTVLGRHLYALGGNEQAARLSGIRTDDVKWFAYCFSAITASIGRLLYMADQQRRLARQPGPRLRAERHRRGGRRRLQPARRHRHDPRHDPGRALPATVIDAVAKLIKSGADIYEGMIVGIVVVLAVTFTQLRQLAAVRRRVLSGVRGAGSPIPTLASRRASLRHDGQRQRRPASKAAIVPSASPSACLARRSPLGARQARLEFAQHANAAVEPDPAGHWTLLKPDPSSRSTTSPSAFPAWSPWRTCRSTCCRASCTPSAARTAPARAR